MIGMQLDTDYKLMIKPKRDANGLITSGVVIGDITDQCAALALQCSPGDIKEDILLGAGLTKFIRGKYNKTQVEQRMRQHLTRAGINYNEYKDRLSTTINKGE